MALQSPRERPLRTAELVAHVLSILAVLSTLVMVGPMATESNPGSALLIERIGMNQWAMLTPLGVAAIFAVCRWLYRNDGERYASVSAGLALAGLTFDAGGNLGAMLAVGLPETVRWGAIGETAVVVVALAGLCLWRPDPRVMVRAVPRPSVGQARVVGVVLLAVLLAVAGVPAGVFGPGATLESVETVRAAQWDFTGTTWSTSGTDNGADVADGFVYVIEQGGTVKEFYKNGTATGTSFDASQCTDCRYYGIEKLDNGNYIVVEGYINDRAIEVDSSGSLVEVKTGSEIPSGGITGVEETSDGFYITEKGSGTKVFEYSSTWTHETNHTGLSNSMGGIEKKKRGHIYITDATDGDVHEFYTNFTEVTTHGLSEQGSPGGLGKDPSTGNWFVAGGDIHEYSGSPVITDLSGQVVTQESGDPVSNATVSIFGYDYANINTSQGELSTIKTKMQDPEPPSWETEQQQALATSAGGEKPVLFKQAAREDWNYTAVHSAGAWDLQACGDADRELPEGSTSRFSRCSIAALTSVENPVAGDPQLGPGGIFADEFGLRRVFAADEPLVLTVWDASKTSEFLVDDIDEDLPGRTTKGTIVLQRIGPLGNVTYERNLTTHPRIKSSNLILADKTHHTVELDPAPGFYRVYPKGQPEASHMFVVAPNANTEQLVAWMNQSFQTKLDQKREHAKKIEEYVNNNKVSNQTTTTNQTGHFSLNFSSSTVQEATLQAYKQPEGMDGNKTPQEIVDTYDDKLDSAVSDLSEGDVDLDTLNKTDRLESVCDKQLDTVSDTGSLYEPTSPETVQLPDTNVTVEMKEVNLPTDLGTIERLCAKTSVANTLEERGLVDQIPTILQNLSNMSADEIDDWHTQLVTKQLSDPTVCKQTLRQRGVDNLEDCGEPAGVNGSEDGIAPDPGRDGSPGCIGPCDDVDGDGETDGVDIDPPDDRSEAESQIDDMAAGLESLKETVEAEAEDVTIEDGNVTVTWSVPGEVPKDRKTSVFVDFSTGTSMWLDYKYPCPTPDQDPGACAEDLIVEHPTLPGGSSTVTMQNFQLGDNDPAVANFRLMTTTKSSDGETITDNNTTVNSSVGETVSDSVQVTNPTFNGTRPEVASLRVSTLAPGPDDRVTVEAIPADDDNVTVSNITVTGPNGSSIGTTNVSNGEASFQTNGTGEYTIKAHLQKDGVTFVETLKTTARGANIERPPSIKVGQGPTGTHAIVADGFTAGHYTAENNGQHIRLSGVISQSASAPSVVHAYVQGADAKPNTDITVRVLRGADEETVRSRYTAKIHVGKLSEDAIVYRMADSDSTTGDPIPFDERSQWGTVNQHANGSTVEVVSGSDGAVTARVLNDPSFIQSVLYDVQLAVPFDLPMNAPSLSLPLPRGPALPSLPLALSLSALMGLVVLGRGRGRF